MAGLRPDKRKRITQKVKANSDNTYEIGQKRGELKSRRRSFEKETTSARGATATAQRATTSVPTNLKGPEGRQLRQELRGRSKDLARGLPLLLSEAQASYKGDRADILSDIQRAQFDRGQEVKSAVQSVLEHQKKEAKARAEDAAAEAKKIAENKAGKSADVQHALDEAKRLIREQQLVNHDPNADEKDKRPSAVPQNEADWIDFENALRTKEGVDARSARKAVKRLQRAVAAPTHPRRGPGPGRGPSVAPSGASRAYGA